MYTPVEEWQVTFFDGIFRQFVYQFALSHTDFNNFSLNVRDDELSLFIQFIFEKIFKSLMMLLILSQC